MPRIKTNQPKLPWVTTSVTTKKSWGFDTKFYRRKKWRNLRQYFLSINPLCVECEKKGLLVTSTVVDHIIPRKERRDLELDESNLQALCESCHNSKSRREQGRGGQNPKNQSIANRCGERNSRACKTQT